jgi:hypothetical protein
MQGSAPLKTAIYIDGYNLYYAALTKSTYKWLDLYELFGRTVVRSIEPNSEILKIKFFTAPVLGRYASDPASPNRQTCYHNAVRSAYPDFVEIIKGYHSEAEKKGLPVDNSIGTDGREHQLAYVSRRLSRCIGSFGSC